ncbi:EF-P beta-lysylation protein EpmB [Vibrio sp. HA2012]|uniref:EF-P beta-lysylation protein EpmB n=1 Tax=Vibrio sp. HA2012 TaxID=1971595 RepID=UPI000C2C8201|nr:EF-P beta-lysylation protein EpmB [Vibrio sp. HA2012]PJC85259.1 EF-P beta-lysylation protein EpmB [Vibrio sp. HA2012]
MLPIITRKSVSVEQNWLNELASAISDPEKLLTQLGIPQEQWPHPVEGCRFAARKLFAQRVPQSFIRRMEKGNIHDPLLRQVLPINDELEYHPGYSVDPLEEQDNELPGLLHKYHNRALLILKGGCAINCRYCFRRHFPYNDNKGSKSVWQRSLDYIEQHAELNEIILSGGDPLMAKDNELRWLTERLEQIPHIRRLRIHTRLPVVIPSRITTDLCELLRYTRLKTILVTHINHKNEMDQQLVQALQMLKNAGVTLLNQSVLLKGVNDSAETQIALSEALFDNGVQPYYLHVLDKVQGAAHFYVSDTKAKAIVREMMTQVSGYMVPRLTREEGGKPSKTPLDLGMEND